MKSKWLLGGLGFVLGGPIGALIGVAIGSLFDSTTALPQGDEHESDTSSYTSGSSRSAASPADIRVSLLVLIACVMKADGHVKRVELDVVKRFLVRNYGEQGALEALQVLKKLLNSPINPDAVAGQIAANINYSTRLELVHFLLELANVDGVFSPDEEQVVLSISNNLHVSAADYRSLLSLYQKTKDPDWAYKALEIEPGATNDEVKKAYRRMAMKYHPDKVAGAGQEVQESATQKFRAINEAYEHIKAQRGDF